MPFASKFFVTNSFKLGPESSVSDNDDIVVLHKLFNVLILLYNYKLFCNNIKIDILYHIYIFINDFAV